MGYLQMGPRDYAKFQNFEFSTVNLEDVATNVCMFGCAVTSLWFSISKVDHRMKHEEGVSIGGGNF